MDKSYTSEKLSKKLYFLSDWNDTDKVLVKYENTSPVQVVNNVDYSQVDLGDDHPYGKFEWQLPLYDTDFFMKKLPKMKFFEGNAYFLGILSAGDETNKWVAGYYCFSPFLELQTRETKIQLMVWHQQMGDTYHDAMANLAISLIRKKEIGVQSRT